MTKITIDPVTRIEGHLKIETVVEDGVVKDAHSTGNLFRGIELILRGRDPRRPRPLDRDQRQEDRQLSGRRADYLERFAAR